VGGGASLSVVRADKSADDRDEHCHLDADQPGEVAVYLLIGGIEPLVHLSLQVGETLIHLFEAAVHLFETAVHLFETAVDLLEQPVHFILQPEQGATQIGPAHGVCVHSGLEGGHPFFQC
jgi:hypothetical protein